MLINNYTNSNKFILTQRNLKGIRDKVLIEDNNYSIVKINNVAYKPYKFTLWEFINVKIIAQNLLNIE